MRELINHIISTRRKRNALRKTKQKLWQRYGAARYYTPGQVRSCYEAGVLGQTSIVYAYALFLRRDDFDSLGLEATQGRNYEDLRNGIEDIGNPHSNPTPHSGSGGYDGGSDSGGGGGGGDG